MRNLGAWTVEASLRWAQARGIQGRRAETVFPTEHGLAFPVECQQKTLDPNPGNVKFGRTDDRSAETAKRSKERFR